MLPIATATTLLRPGCRRIFEKALDLQIEWDKIEWVDLTANFFGISKEEFIDEEIYVPLLAEFIRNNLPLIFDELKKHIINFHSANLKWATNQTRETITEEE